MAQNTSAQPALSWTIVGRGAIGLLAASRLQLCGNAISLWLRAPDTVTVKFAAHQLQFPPARPPLSAVLVPVKSYAVIDAVRGLLPNLTPDAQLVLSHNGMGSIEQVLPLLKPRQGLWFLTTTHGALKHADSVIHTGVGQSVLAPLNSAARAQQTAVLKTMDCALGPVSIVDDIVPFLWQKLAINALINPLTALHNCRNGALTAPQFQPQLAAILQEVCQVAQANGIALDFADAMRRLRQVISNTAQNYSSMQQDISLQRRTEIDAINGYIVRQAAQAGIAAPLNEHLLQQVLQLEQAVKG